ncbi:protein-L-isoaspartate O-methyltransferase family protein [Spirochaeta isovalerica]|uniref:Protein-L-isoaspartate O-methyltransferase n=1 Tax=Spirochaeta isovalerica TaxID=150 RepID=A0A841R4V7_9SPIO|nr:hypothetical protein [Spirochaeta isovalerica]MBB6478431.1 protein-L-isoaspartate(D-aspartate) O-methyltransferase [Spirochaeta isovalerica]
MKYRFFASILFLSIFLIPLYPQNDANTSALNMLANELFPESDENETAMRKAFISVPRADYLEGTYKNLAYRDLPLPAGGGLIHPAPSLIASILKEASISDSTRVFLIGRNTSYISEIISKLTNFLYVSDPGLSADPNEINYQGKKNLSYFGWIEDSPFNLIIIFGSLNEIPRSLVNQLSINGKIIAPLESQTGNQILVSAVKYNDGFSIKSIGPSYIHKLQ